MAQLPPQPPDPLAVYAASPQPVQPSPPLSANGMGLAGLIVSIAGLFSCGLLSPIGILLSSLALRKLPRGLAIAGLIVGLLGLPLIAVPIALGWGFRKAAHEFKAVDAEMSAMDASVLIDDHAGEHDALPDDDVGQGLIALEKDPWDRAMRYRRLDAERYEVRSAGADGRFDTPDDVSYAGDAGDWKGDGDMPVGVGMDLEEAGRAIEEAAKEAEGSAEEAEDSQAVPGDE